MPSSRVLRKPTALSLLALLLLWASAPIATATIIEIPLPQLNGPLFEGDRTRSMPYDLGVEFLDIEYMHVAATVQASPTVLKRLDTGELVYRPGLIGFSVSGQITHEGQMYDVERFTGLPILETDPTLREMLELAVGWPSVIVLNEDSVRVTSERLMPPGSSLAVSSGSVPRTFSRAEIEVSLWGVYLSDVETQRIAYPTAVVSDARLIVSGTIVPEPTTAFLLALGGVACLRQRYRSL